MNVQTRPNLSAAQRLLPFEHVVLVLQGGGALGAYQAGVYEALAESGIHPDWIAGISIGGINAAIIAGNPPNMKVDRLREFWTQVTSEAPWNWFGWAAAKGDGARNILNQFSANAALMQGANGFFAARPLSPWLQPSGTLEATSLCSAEGEISNQPATTRRRLHPQSLVSTGHPEGGVGANAS